MYVGLPEGKSCTLHSCIHALLCPHPSTVVVIYGQIKKFCMLFGKKKNVRTEQLSEFQAVLYEIMHEQSCLVNKNGNKSFSDGFIKHHYSTSHLIL